MPKTYIIIGTSAAALGVLSKLRTLDPEGTIICISQEAELPYNKCLLADYMAGIKEQRLVFTRPYTFFEQHNISLLLGIAVAALNAEQKTIRLADGQQLSYDVLFLGTGSSPMRSNFIGVEYAHTFHTLADTQYLLERIQQGISHAVVIGAGLSGVECADALAARGVRTTLVTPHNKILNRYFDEHASALVEQQMYEAGVTLVKHTRAQGITRTGNRLTVTLEKGNLTADLVVLATGLSPNSQLAAQAGLMLKDGYIVVDESLRTSDAAIWAGGDCCIVKDQFTTAFVGSCTWPDAMQQGVIAAYGMTGKAACYAGALIMPSSRFFKLPFFVAGILDAGHGNYGIIISQGAGWYHKFIVDKHLLKGFLLVGNTQAMPLLKRILLTKAPFNLRDLTLR